MKDLIIVGAGPAGLTAAMFAERQGLDVLVFDNPEQPSNLAITHLVENYPGVEKIVGIELLNRMKKQTSDLGIEIINEKVGAITKNNDFSVQADKHEYKCRSIILAMGLQHRKANIQGEDKFFGKGITYCTVCDGPLFKGKDVVVIGGGDSALKNALALKDIGVNKIYLVHRRDEFRAEKAWQDKVRESSINIILDSVVDEILGKDFVDAIRVKNVKTGEIKEIAVKGVFVEIGSVPVAGLVKGLGVKLDENGFIITNEDKETNVPGIFAAGDISTGQLKQDVTAVADGALAAASAYRFLKG